MINSFIATPVTLSSNSSPVAFQGDSIVTRSSTCCGWLQHSTGSPLYKILKGGIYEIEFSGTVTSTTAGIVALGFLEDGVLLPCTVGAETLAAAGDLANISIHKTIRICCNGDVTLTLASVPSVIAGATLVPTDTEIPTITSGNLTIKKIA